MFRRPWKLKVSAPPRTRLPPIALTADEHLRLTQLARRRSACTLSLRARIVLSSRHGRSNRDVARRLGVTVQTVGKWRRRFLEHGAAGLLDQPRSGAPRSISDGVVEAVLTMTLHEMPAGAPRWSSRRLAAAVGVSQSTVLRIWRAFGL
jgi:transposase